jgi:hypothetical protein
MPTTQARHRYGHVKANFTKRCITVNTKTNAIVDVIPSRKRLVVYSRGIQVPVVIHVHKANEDKMLNRKYDT